MGGIVDHPPGEPYVETAFRTILFTDIEGSTSLTQQLGDARAMSMLRTHDEIVRDALAAPRRIGGQAHGRWPDGRFPLGRGRDRVRRPDPAARSPRRSGGLGVPLRVRIGMSAGEPVTERDDLFGAAVQLAARLCGRAEPGTILVSRAVHDLALGKGFEFRKRGPLRLKGFDEPVTSSRSIGLPREAKPCCGTCPSPRSACLQSSPQRRSPPTRSRDPHLIHLPR